MVETIAQVFGMAFCGIILVCIVWTFGSYIIGSYDEPSKSQNDELLDNMNKMKK